MFCSNVTALCCALDLNPKPSWQDKGKRTGLRKRRQVRFPHLGCDSPQRSQVVLRELLCRLCTAEMHADVKPSNLLRKSHAGSSLLACLRCSCLAAQRLLSQCSAAGDSGCKCKAGRPASQSSVCVMSPAGGITSAGPHTGLLACLRSKHTAMQCLVSKSSTADPCSR